MSDGIETCAGETPDGKKCPCRRYSLNPKQKPGEPILCVNCKHWDTAHPQPVMRPASASESTQAPSAPFDIKSLVASFKTASSSRFPSTEKASVKEALEETRTGLRRTSQGGTSSSQKPKKTTKGGKVSLSHAAAPSQFTGKEIKLGTVVLMPDGLDENKQLYETRAPSTRVILDLEPHGLAISRVVPAEPLVFYTDWDSTQVEAWLEGLFPKVFAFLRAQISEDSDAVVQPLWHLLEKKNKTVSKVNIAAPGPTGGHLDMFLTNKRRPWHECSLYFVTQYAIPEVVWQNDWVEVEESTTGTPSDEEDAPPLRRSHRPKATLKRTRESSGEESFASESESDSDSDVVIIEDTKGKGKARSRPAPRPRKKRRAASPSSTSQKSIAALFLAESDVDNDAASHHPSEQPGTPDHDHSSHSQDGSGHPSSFFSEYPWDLAAPDSPPHSPIAGPSTSVDKKESKPYLSLEGFSRVEDNPW